MKKIILSAAVAAMALTTTASALEDIKVSGQAKLWYETNDVATNDMFDQGASSGEVVFKLGMTGKQGNVGFGATVYQTSTMGLENNLVSGTRTNTTGLSVSTYGVDTNGDGVADATGYDKSGDMFVGEAYVTLPAVADTVLKIGKQELDTPLAFTERWNAVPNTFNAAVAINSSLPNTTLIAAYVGQDNATDWKVDQTFSKLFDTALAAAALYKTDAFGVNAWYYQLRSTAQAVWIDGNVKVGPANLGAVYAKMMPAANIGPDDTTAYALSASTEVSNFTLSAAYSDISKKGTLAVANTSTGFKKTKLPTAGVYTDGAYVAQKDSTAWKVKAATKIAATGTGLALQYINNDNDTTVAKKTSEVDFIVTQKVGDVNFKAILLNRDFDDAATDASTGGTHVRVIASVNF